ncbi:uncharacterized protein DNG_08197 [Cephalotrichum gorgonifer]|uniref:Zn(2)-C6 fungal-type domain-containing protein n=1 Tax=Cephalotrichum gorgonifer TaxID=2041049 RepID=A0AAE8N3A6_9PEZI|nr:uncharacterized protein DNG_08197 [Cephalotrichum gorgonifer]
MADSPTSSHQGNDYHAYASNGLQVLQAATNAHQAIFQDAPDNQVDHHHDLQQAAQQASQQHLQQQQQQQEQDHLDEFKQEPQQQQQAVHHDPDGTSMPQTPGQQHLTLQGISSSPARIIADPAALAAVAAAAGAQDALAHDTLTQDALVQEALAPRTTPGSQPHHHHAHTHAHPHTHTPTPVHEGGRDPSINPKLTRLSRACDNCSQRKVKCDAVRPCKPCLDLNLECTNSRVVKRRGPPNKAVEAIRLKKQRMMEEAGQAGLASPSAASVNGGLQAPGYPSTPHTAAQALVSIAGTENQTRLDGEAIAPRTILEALVDDFFTYIHPLCPFPHQPTFQAAFVNREDRTDPEFLALLASMIGALVASFPRTARAHLKNLQSTQMFPRAVTMIEKCRDIALEARGARWAAKQPKTMNDAATSYFLCLMASYTLQNNICRLHMGETLSVLNELGFNRPKHPGDLPTFGSDICEPDRPPFNHIKDQTGKKIFWCVFLGVRSMFQLGSSHAGLVLAPPTPSQPYPSYPANADDKDVQANEVMEQDPETTTLMTGFRIAADIYMTMNGIVSVEMSYGLESLKWSGQRQMMKEGLLAAKVVLDNLPEELQLLPPGQDPSAAFDDPSLEYVPPGYALGQHPHDVRHVIKLHPARRRRLQLEIQKANVFCSQLATRSYFVELYFTRRNFYDPDIALLAGGADSTEEENEEMREEEAVRVLMTEERDAIVEDLLVVLGAISQRSLEPNGNSLITKIRQVASTLLQSAPGRDPLSERHMEALSSLLQVLTRLEKTSTRSGSTAEAMTDKDEEEELGTWASLRDYQARFSAHGGYAGHL